MYCVVFRAFFGFVWVCLYWFCVFFWCVVVYICFCFVLLGMIPNNPISFWYYCKPKAYNQVYNVRTWSPVYHACTYVYDTWTLDKVLFCKVYINRIAWGYFTFFELCSRTQEPVVVPLPHYIIIHKHTNYTKTISNPYYSISHQNITIFLRYPVRLTPYANPNPMQL